MLINDLNPLFGGPDCHSIQFVPNFLVLQEVGFIVSHFLLLEMLLPLFRKIHVLRLHMLLDQKNLLSQSLAFVLLFFLLLQCSGSMRMRLWQLVMIVNQSFSMAQRKDGSYSIMTFD